MPYVGKKPADIIATAVDTTTGTFSGEVDAASLDISGNIDVDGTTNLDVVDIDGAVDMASTLTLAGNADFNGDLDVDGTTNLDNTDIDGTLNVSGVATFQTHIELGDSDQIRLGAGNDMQIFHNGTDSFVQDEGTGNLKIRTNGSAIELKTVADEAMVIATKDGAVDLYHNNSKKFETTSSGVIVDNKLQGASGESLTIESQSGGAVILNTNGANERLRVTSAGELLVGGLTSSNSSGESLQVYDNGQVPLSVGRQQDGTIVHLRVGSVNGATHGSISISGTTCSFNAFSGSHWSRLSDNSKPTILKGTIIETIDEMCDWYQAEFTVPATDEEDEYVMSEPIGLPSGKSVGDTITHTYKGTDYTATIIKEGDEKHVKCKISNTADSNKVYGVHSAWDEDDDSVNDMYVTAVGTHVVRINKDVTVSAGDLLSSNGDGTAKVQDDDIIRSKTIGKVLTNIKQETYDDGSYTVPCALYCG